MTGYEKLLEAYKKRNDIPEEQYIYLCRHYPGWNDEPRYYQFPLEINCLKCNSYCKYAMHDAYADEYLVCFSCGCDYTKEDMVSFKEYCEKLWKQQDEENKRSSL